MRRAEFLNLTGLSVDRLKNLERRGEAPFSEAADESGRAYDYRRVFATKLVLALNDYMDLRQAKTIVEDYLDVFVAGFGEDLIEGRPVYFGWGRFFTTSDSGDLHDAGLVAGALHKLHRSHVVGLPFERFDLKPLAAGHDGMTGLCLVDATRELQAMREWGDHPVVTDWIRQARSAG